MFSIEVMYADEVGTPDADVFFTVYVDNSVDATLFVKKIDEGLPESLATGTVRMKYIQNCITDLMTIDQETVETTLSGEFYAFRITRQ